MNTLTVTKNFFSISDAFVPWLLNQTVYMYEEYWNTCEIFKDMFVDLPNAKTLVDRVDEDEEYINAYTSVHIYDNETKFLDYLEDEEQSNIFWNVKSDFTGNQSLEDMQKAMVVLNFTCSDENDEVLVGPTRSVW